MFECSCVGGCGILAEISLVNLVQSHFDMSIPANFK